MRFKARICKPFKAPGESIPSQAGRYDLLEGPARQATIEHRLAESILWNRFLGTSNVYKFGLSYAKETVSYRGLSCCALNVHIFSAIVDSLEGNIGSRRSCVSTLPNKMVARSQKAVSAASNSRNLIV